jgi:CheY-like chemotaxis protein
VTQPKPSVLVVEDDVTMRLMMVGTLKRCGLEVLDAPTGGDAIRILRDSDRLDVLVSNVNRPWPDGVVMARHARAHHPEVAILFVADAAERQRLGSVVGPYRCLPKPWRRAGLEAALEVILPGMSIQQTSFQSAETAGAPLLDPAILRSRELVAVSKANGEIRDALYNDIHDEMTLARALISCSSESRRTRAVRDTILLSETAGCFAA